MSAGPRRGAAEEARRLRGRGAARPRRDRRARGARNRRDDGGSDAQAAEVFPDGGSFPEQKIFDGAGRRRRLHAEDVKGTSREHTTSLDQRVKYNTNPPTSGRH